MLTDREQIVLAAKAVGMNVLPPNQPWPDGVNGWFQTSREGDVSLYSTHRAMDVWNPLKDDGDALRLVVRLLQLGVWEKPHTWQSIDGWKDDPYAATRRAIVRAAAEIGKAMEATC